MAEPMDEFNIIDCNRKRHGYTQMRWRSYKNSCNTMSREARKQGDLSLLIYRLEANVAKFHLFQSPRYIHKCLRLLKGCDSRFCNTYREYLGCYLLEYRKQFQPEMLVKLWHELADFYSFVNDIYRLADDRIDFDQYKVQHQWNDITMLFETKKMAELFSQGSLVCSDNRFNTQMAVRILAVEESRKKLASAVNSPDVTLIEASNVSGKLYDSVLNLFNFLTDNYVASEYTKELLDETSSVCSYIKQLLELNVGNSDVNPAEFKIPRLFQYCADGLKSLVERGGLNPSVLRSALLDRLKNMLKATDDATKLPFLPVFYDIAFDYVKYPPLESSVIHPLSDINISKK